MSLTAPLNILWRANPSCETALTLMVDTWLSALNRGNEIGLLLVDLYKALDPVDVHDNIVFFNNNKYVN